MRLPATQKPRSVQLQAPFQVNRSPCKKSKFLFNRFPNSGLVLAGIVQTPNLNSKDRNHFRRTQEILAFKIFNERKSRLPPLSDQRVWCNQAACGDPHWGCAEEKSSQFSRWKGRCILRKCSSLCSFGLARAAPPKNRWSCCLLNRCQNAAKFVQTLQRLRKVKVYFFT